jgi:hypothetical protein
VSAKLGWKEKTAIMLGKKQRNTLSLRVVLLANADRSAGRCTPSKPKYSDTRPIVQNVERSKNEKHSVKRRAKVPEVMACPSRLTGRMKQNKQIGFKEQTTTLLSPIANILFRSPGNPFLSQSGKSNETSRSCLFCGVVIR